MEVRRRRTEHDKHLWDERWEEHAVEKLLIAAALRVESTAVHSAAGLHNARGDCLFAV
jgi:hypothetical protein